MGLTRRALLAAAATQAAALALAACGNGGTASMSASGSSTLALTSSAASTSAAASTTSGAGMASAAPSTSASGSQTVATTATSGSAATTVTASSGPAAASGSATTTASASTAATSSASAATGSSSLSYVSQAPSADVLKGLHASLTGAGSTFDYPLFSKLFADFHQLAPGVTVNYQSIGSGGGVQQLTQKTVDFGASDYPLNADQEKALPAPALHVPVTLGAASVGYNVPGVPSGLKLSGDALAGIYLGDITAWDDPKLAALNPGLKLPSTPIAVVHRSDSSGTTFMFTSFLAAVSAAWKGKVGASGAVNWPVGIGAKGSEGVSGQVKQTPGAVGYFELAYSTQNQIPVASIQNADGAFVAPSPAGASAAAAGAASNLPADLKAVLQNPPGKDVYPISGFSWVLVYQELTDAAKAQALVNLLAWVVTAGQQSAEALTYAPLPEQVVTLDLAQLRKITLNGKPVLG